MDAWAARLASPVERLVCALRKAVPAAEASSRNFCTLAPRCARQACADSHRLGRATQLNRLIPTAIASAPEARIGRRGLRAVKACRVVNRSSQRVGTGF